MATLDDLLKVLARHALPEHDPSVKNAAFFLSREQLLDLEHNDDFTAEKSLIDRHIAYESPSPDQLAVMTYLALPHKCRVHFANNLSQEHSEVKDVPYRAAEIAFIEESLRTKGLEWVKSFSLGDRMPVVGGVGLRVGMIAEYITHDIMDYLEMLAAPSRRVMKGKYGNTCAEHGSAVLKFGSSQYNLFAKYRGELVCEIDGLMLFGEMPVVFETSVSSHAKMKQRWRSQVIVGGLFGVMPVFVQVSYGGKDDNVLRKGSYVGFSCDYAGQINELARLNGAK